MICQVCNDEENGKLDVTKCTCGSCGAEMCHKCSFAHADTHPENSPQKQVKKKK